MSLFGGVTFLNKKNIRHPRNVYIYMSEIHCILTLKLTRDKFMKSFKRLIRGGTYNIYGQNIQGTMACILNDIVYCAIIVFTSTVT